ncbi:uncharacterized protein BXZ73DRAFT_81246 [Epithele typhae]|uniref:uncharacterized protein n=1 Tax=Epithele typhae TaxID=378194 RepID=UPI002008C56F|nr:uncharacterized protein BXZ73DRAFT_81246 [Epithele typhae]KAH9915772.1 hypothetical protein BXZ73DRAFT_81246 [Epithele typhae]
MAMLVQYPAPMPRQGILLNPSPAASPAFHPASLPALVPSNSSLSSSASSSAPGESSDYFAKSASPSPGPSHPRDPKRASHSKARAGSNPSTVRRIRFAPLPEPRRDEEEDGPYPPVFLDDDDAAEQLAMFSALPSVSTSLDPKSPVGATSSPRICRRPLAPDSLLLDPSSPNPDACSPATPTAAQLADPAHDAVPLSPLTPLATAAAAPLPDSPRRGRWSKMLKPLLGRSTPKSPSFFPRTSSIDSTASLDLPRGRGGAVVSAASSRDSSISREGAHEARRNSDFGAPLHRWTSEGAAGAGVGLPLSKKKRLMLFGGGGSGSGGVPLERTQSLTSLSGKERNKPAPRAAGAAAPANGARKQTRMLNGRVYGAKRRKSTANPFDNVRTDEPEFVEWGYGGMGSVKSAGQHAMWSRLQAGNDAAGVARTDADEDDGTGMTWVKKRKEQREREKREREEREKAEAEAKAKAEESAANGEEEPAAEVAEAVGEETTQPEPVQEVEPTVLAPIAEVSIEQTASSPTPGTPVAVDGSKPAPATSEHITTAVAIPAPSPHRHHHAHSNSQTFIHPGVERRESAEAARAAPVVTPGAKGEVSVPVAEKAHPPDTEESSANNTSDDEDSEGSPKETDGESGQEDDDDDEDDEEQRRPTATSAGIEKFARHHKEDQSAAGTPAAEPSS